MATVQVEIGPFYPLTLNGLARIAVSERYETFVDVSPAYYEPQPRVLFP